MAQRRVPTSHLDAKRVKPMQQNTSSLSRRKVTAGLAWSVPAVAAVAATPFAAASHHCPTVTGVGDAVKYPGRARPA